MPVTLAPCPTRSAMPRGARPPREEDSRAGDILSALVTGISGPTTVGPRCEVAQSQGAYSQQWNSRGKRWAQTTNLLTLATLVGAGATAYFYYKGYVGKLPKRERARFVPAVSPSGVGVQLGIDF